MPERSKKSTMETAVKFIAYRMRSEAEVRKHLMQKGFEAIEVDATIAKLIEYGYINDKVFAEELVRSKTAQRPTGRRRLAQALYQSGVSDEVAGIALDAYSQLDEQSACDELFIKLVRIKGGDAKARAKIQRSMLQRGFSYEQISSSTRRLSEEDIFDME